MGFTQKWQALEHADLQVNTNLTDKDIIILDDLYQSRLTMQYVAMKLKQAGARNLYGLELVNTVRDTDNK